MSGGSGGEVDKKAIGARIKTLRKQTGLRQWQLAELIGATQPAIHMYERGVLPEPRRLLELARIGGTTVEWILTGRHWENGSEEMRRVDPEVCRLAHRFMEFDAGKREALASALRIIERAVGGLERAGESDDEARPPAEVLRQLEAASGTTLKALRAALRIHEAVARAIAEESVERFTGSGLVNADVGPPESDGNGSDGTRRRYARVGSSSIEAVRGNIFRLDGSLLAIHEILKDRELRTELEASLDKMIGRLEAKRTRTGRGHKDPANRQR